MREHGIPQFTVDAHRPVRAFDVLGVSFSTELGYTNLLDRARPGRHPAARRDRDDDAPDRARRRPRGVQPRADRRLPRRRGPRRRRGGRCSPSPRSCASGRREGRPGGRDELLRRLAASGGVYVPKFYDVAYADDGRIARVAPNRPDVPWRVAQAHADGPRRVALPAQPAGAAGRDRARALQRRDLPRLHAWLPLLPGRHDHPPGARALDHHDRRDGRERAPASPASRRSGCCPCRAPTTARSARSRRASPTATRAPTSRSVLPSTRVDAFNITLANEFSRNGRRSGLTFAPEGGSRADAQGDQQDGHRGGPDPDGRHGVLPRLAAGEALLHVRAADRDRRGRPGDRRPGEEGHREGPRGVRPQRHPLHRLDRRLRAQAAHPVPVGRAARPRDHRRAAAEAARRRARRQAVRPGDRLPLPRRQARGSSRDCSRAATAASAPSSSGSWRDGGRFDGWSEHFSYDRWVAAADAALQATAVDLDWYTTRERDYDEVLPWDHLDSGLDKDWLWEDWQDALDPDGRGRGLPLDPLLRLRRLPGDGHRDPDRPDRADAAAAQRRSE